MNEQETATPAQTPTGRNGSGSEQEKLKAIRDILVGDQLQDLNTRFRTLEQSQQAQYAKIGSELMTKFEALKVLSKSQVEELNNSVAELVAQLQENDAGLSKELEESKAQVADLAKRVNDMPASLAQQLRKMHEQFSTQMSEFSRTVRARQDEVARESVSRKDFAKLLNGLAGKLAQEEPKPANESSPVLQMPQKHVAEFKEIANATA